LKDFAASSGHVGYLINIRIGTAITIRYTACILKLLGKTMGGRNGGRPIGAKNAKTVWREAQELVGDGELATDAADPLEVIEEVVRYFYAMGVQGVGAKAPVDEVQKCFNRALHAASIAAPYRHARLSAVKHIDNADTIDGISANATPEELRAEIAKRIALLRDKGYVDLDALPAPSGDVTAPEPDDSELSGK
jgi:hypothetical protein